ncbi:MAG TPA: hypothetical protein PK447_05470 [Ignavibacteria bacterium]|nr:hypothetical protein [Ignavibacteria bacterium]
MPSELNTSKIFFLISAILNLLFSIGFGGFTILGGIASLGCGCLLGFLPVITVVACIMDFIAYNKLSGLNQKGTYSTMQFAAIMDIVTIVPGNVVSLVFGIINLTYLNNPNVKTFLTEKGIY